MAIYEYLFKEGVMVAKKDFHEPKHPDLADLNIPNLHVIKALQVSIVDSVSCSNYFFIACNYLTQFLFF